MKLEAFVDQPRDYLALTFYISLNLQDTQTNKRNVPAYIEFFIYLNLQDSQTIVDSVPVMTPFFISLNLQDSQTFCN